MDNVGKPPTAKEIGALAMIEKLTRIWASSGIYGENIWASFDGEWYKAHNERFIADLIASNSYSHYGNREAQEAYLRRTYKFQPSSYLNFDAQIKDDVRFEYNERFSRWVLYSTRPFPIDDEEPGFKFYGYMGCLSLDNEWGAGIFRADLRAPDGIQTIRAFDRQKQFTADWLPFFRRSCWLCGCDIESTAHEKIEWLQGFSREEIEAWNLKF